MNISFVPKKGALFTLREQKFQVTFCANGVVRYAAVAGGKVFCVPLDEFVRLREELKITLESGDDASLSLSNINTVNRRYRYIQYAITYLRYPTSERELKKIIPNVAGEISDTKAPSARSVARWIKIYLGKSESGLIGRNSQGNQMLRFDPIVEQIFNEAIAKIYLKPEKSNAMDIRAFMVGRLIEMQVTSITSTNIPIPSIRTIQRRIKQLDPYVVVRAQQGEAAAKRYARSAGTQLKSYMVLSLVQIDSHYMDIIVVDPDTGEVLGRPYIVCIIDINTRLIVGTYISLYPPSATTALAALKNMLITYGIPTQIIPDNGVEFKNSAFARVCESLTILITPAQNRDPNGKAHLERFFRSLTQGIVQKLSGTTFSNPAQRGDYSSTKNAVFTLTQVQELVESWINEVYHMTIHTGTGRAPFLAWQDGIKHMPPMRLNEKDVDALARKPYTRTVNNGQVLVDYIEYFSHALTVFNGQMVTVLVDELNLNTVYVNHPDDPNTLILANSNDPDYTKDLTIYIHEESKKIKKELSKDDLRRLGKFSALYARYKLLEKIHSISKVAKRWKKRLTNGHASPKIVCDEAQPLVNEVSHQLHSIKSKLSIVENYRDDPKISIEHSEYSPFESLELEI